MRAIHAPASHQVFSRPPLTFLLHITGTSTRCHATAASGRGNQALLDMLQTSRATEEKMIKRNDFKIRAFNEAIQAIEALDYTVQSAEQCAQAGS